MLYFDVLEWNVDFSLMIFIVFLCDFDIYLQMSCFDSFGKNKKIHECFNE